MRAGLEASTVTPASAPPVPSLTKPRRPPVEVCADAVIDRRVMATARPRLRASHARRNVDTCCIGGASCAERTTRRKTDPRDVLQECNIVNARCDVSQGGRAEAAFVDNHTSFL